MANPFPRARHAIERWFAPIAKAVAKVLRFLVRSARLARRVLFALLHKSRHKRLLRGFRIKAFSPSARRAPQPAWVRREVLRLKALLPNLGCRKIEKLFNRLYAAKRRMTASKSYVAYTVQKHRYEIEILHRKLKQHVPRAIARNRLWAIDLSGKQDGNGELHSILGVLDHGTRKALVLEAPENKRVWTLLGHLFLAIGAFGKPRAIRTDHEAMFKSLVFRVVLWFVGIRRQFTAPGCPWQNGRIERLFGTLKQKLDCIEVESRETLNPLLSEFALWYNAIRPHQHLAGLTPEEAWRGVNPYASTPKAVYWFEAWEGMLTGYYLRY